MTQCQECARRSVEAREAGKLGYVACDACLAAGPAPEEDCDVRQLTVAELQLLAFEYYRAGNVTGGVLHIVLDDGNVERDHVLWCLRQAVEERDWLAVKIATHMLGLTSKERREVYEGRPRR
jgi:hypothetical protein